jgi:hypothetical protein
VHFDDPGEHCLNIIVLPLEHLQWVHPALKFARLTVRAAYARRLFFPLGPAGGSASDLGSGRISAKAAPVLSKVVAARKFGRIPQCGTIPAEDKNRRPKRSR